MGACVLYCQQRTPPVTHSFFYAQLDAHCFCSTQLDTHSVLRTACLAAWTATDDLDGPPGP